jgi:cell fate (sporulation/competence/biofilm development) regulator YlbF (YheA/YmcA/DUF963 family)
MQSADTKSAVYETIVSRAVRDFAAVLAETPQFLAFEQAAEVLQRDDQARKIINSYQSKQESLYMMTMLGAVSPEDQAEMTQLQQALYTNETIATYTQSQADLAAICQETGHRLSERIGLNFAAACGASCCG